MLTKRNEGGSTDPVEFNDVVEWLLVSEVTIRRMPHLEQSIPGFTAAMFVSRVNATYQAPEEERSTRCRPVRGKLGKLCDFSF